MKRVLFIAALVAAGAGYVNASHAASASIAKCPSRGPKTVARGPRAKHFVRTGATSMRVCRYYGANWGDPYGLRGQGRVRAARTIGQITHSFDKLKKPRRGIFCMRDDGSELLVLFSYANAPAERVIVKLSGCRFAMNGRSTRSTTAHLQRRLAHLAKSS